MIAKANATLKFSRGIESITRSSEVFSCDQSWLICASEINAYITTHCSQNRTFEQDTVAN